MIVIFESPTGMRKWKIEPYDNGLCFKLSKTPIGYIDVDGTFRSNKNNKEIKGEWLDCRIYPTTMEHAIEKVVDLMLADPEDQVELQFTGIDMRTALERIFKNWFKKIKLEVQDDAEV